MESGSSPLYTSDPKTLILAPVLGGHYMGLCSISNFLPSPLPPKLGIFLSQGELSLDPRLLVLKEGWAWANQNSWSPWKYDCPPSHK